MPTDTELPNAKAFSERLNRCLAMHGYDERGGNSRLAAEYDVRPPVVSDWRKGRHLPSPNKVRRMAQAWRVSYDWLYWGEGPAPSLVRESSPPTYAAPRKVSDGALYDLRVAVSALYAVMASERPTEAAAIAASLRSKVKPERLKDRDGLLSELLSVLDDARRTPPARRSRSS